jgi:hypothetical protein
MIPIQQADNHLLCCDLKIPNRITDKSISHRAVLETHQLVGDKAHWSLNVDTSKPRRAIQLLYQKQKYQFVH